MKKILTFLILAAIPLTVCGQFNPPPAGAFTYSGSSWVAAVTSATGGALGFTPPPAALYCYNSSLGQWVPADSSCFGGGGAYLPLSGGTLTGPIAFSPIGAANATVGNLGAEGPVTNILGYGAVADGVLFSDCTITATQNTATCPAETFTSGDVGKLFQLYGAGISSGLLVTTISGFTSTHIVTLTANAGTTVTTNGLGSYGTNNATAISNALTAAIGNTNTLFIPSGIFLTNAQIVIQTPGFKIQGVSSAQSQLVYAGTGSIDGFLKIYPVGTPNTSCSPANTCLYYVTLDSLTIRGNTNATSAILKIAGIESNFRHLRIYDALTNGFLDEFDVYSRFDDIYTRSRNNITTSVPSDNSQYSPVNGVYLTSPTGAGGSGTVGPVYFTNLQSGGQTGCGLKTDDSFTLNWTGGSVYGMPAGATAGLCVIGPSAPATSNKFASIDFESNAVIDIYTSGKHDLFDSIQAADGVTVDTGAAQEIFLNGNYVKNFTIASGASKTVLIDCCSDGTSFSDSSTSSVYLTGSGLTIPNASAVTARNAAGTGTVSMAYVDSSNDVIYGHPYAAGYGDTQLRSGNYTLDFTNIEYMVGSEFNKWTWPNGGSIHGTTTGSVDCSFISAVYSDNNSYIGCPSGTSGSLDLHFRTGNNTIDFDSVTTWNANALTTMNVPSGFTIEGKTTTAVAFPLLSWYTDNNLYLGFTTMVGHPVFRTGDGTYSFTGTGLTTFAGPVAMGGTKFTTSGCSVSSTTGNGTAGKMTLGANTCNVVITLNGVTGITAAGGWTCHANDETTAAGNTALYFSANTTTTATLAVPAAAGSTDVIDFSCSPF